MTGSPEIVAAVQDMAGAAVRVQTTTKGPALTVRLAEPLSVLVAATSAVRTLGFTGAIEAEGQVPAAPGLPLGAVG